MPTVEIYTKDWCGYCRAAKALLQELGFAFTDIDVTHDEVRYQEMLGRSNGRYTVPQIFFDGTGIGGYTDLVQLARAGRLPAP
jgi:GrxC family glutaredoxin